jgi:hypothetical protein
MNVASLELCKELEDLSGWEPENFYDLDPDKKPEEYFSTSEDRLMSPDGDYVAAYDLGYLLRKLPSAIPPRQAYVGSRNERSVFKLMNDDLGSWWALYSPGGRSGCDAMEIAPIPEDAVCKLAIGLFKQGVLLKHG